MSASQATVSRHKQVLEKEIEEEQTSINVYKKDINPKDDEKIWVLEAKKSRKEREFKKCYWFQYWAKSNLLDDISNLQCRIDELKPLQEHKRELDELEQKLRDISEHGWGKYPGSLDDKIVVEYLNKFTTLPIPLTPKVPFINIIMIGVTGSGKSSFLRTFATALTNSDYIKDIYRACPIKNREKSATKKIHYEPIYMGDKGPKVPCRFFDMPGIDEEETIKKNELEKLLIGELTCTLNDEINQETDMDIQRPNPANVVHCILYVIRASTNLKDLSTSVKSMIEVLKDHNSEVTSIDEIGVPNSDMINAYKYPCVRKFCKEVSVVFGVDLLHVIPVSNYFDEVAPNDAKNAMSLFNLWRVFNSTKEYIERRWLKGETIMISKEWSCKNNNV